MATITFDTLKFVEKLKSGGIPEDQAKAISEAFRDASGEADLITKMDLQIELAPLRADLHLIKWMLGILLGGVMALILKAFFQCSHNRHNRGQTTVFWLDVGWFPSSGVAPALPRRWQRRLGRRVTPGKSGRPRKRPEPESGEWVA